MIDIYRIMIKKLIISMVLGLWFAGSASAQGGPYSSGGMGKGDVKGAALAPSAKQGQPHAVGTLPAQRKYSLIVNEGNDSTVKEFNRGLESGRGNRSFLTDMLSLYRSSFSSQATSAATALVNMGFEAIVEATKSKRPKWEKAVNGESTFVRVLPMQMEILDFYRNPSTAGPLDPTDLYFNGFGCRQVLEYTDAQGNPQEKEVFYLDCKVRTDSLGRMRMLNHSKFEVYVDSLRFDYALCDLPNDSLGVDTHTRIGFDFAKRQDLRFNVKAKLTSSWITQAMMVYKDQELGEFNVTACIDPDKLDADGIFTYSASNPADRAKRVSVSGESFLVPRSYVGSTDMQTMQDAWGTGQYKVEMQVSETCKINTDYYMKDGKWNREAWEPEWKLIRSRRRGPSVWRRVLDVIGMQYADGKWVNTLIDPLKTSVINFETQGINHLINGASPAMPTSAAAAQGKAAAAQAGAAASAGSIPPAAGKK